MEQLLWCVAMVAVAFASFRAAMVTRNELTVFSVMFFCIAIGGAVGALRNHLVDGCIMGWIGCLVGFYFLVYIHAL